MRIYKLFADVVGASHWQDVEVTLKERVYAPPAKGIEIFASEPAIQMMVLRLRSGWNEPIHPTPAPQNVGLSFQECQGHCK